MKYSPINRSLPNGLKIGVESTGQMRRRQQQETFGHALQVTAKNDHRVAAARRSRAQLRVEADSPAEIDRPGDVGDEAVGAALEDEAVAVLGLDHPAQTVAAFQQHHVEPGIELCQSMRGRQPADSAADHDDAFSICDGLIQRFSQMCF